MGVVLALSAVFAVVISTISLTSDKATAQEADEQTDAIAERAEAWWNSLNNVQMVNALHGYEEGHDPAEDGRQLGDPMRTNTNPQVLDADDNPGVAYSDAERAQRMFDDLDQADKDTVIALVNGDSDDTGGDIYAVGEHFDDVGRALRGFQSVPQWWAYVDCAEARRSVGEDNNAITAVAFNDPYTDEAETTTEPSAVCEVVGEVDSEVVQVKAYSDLGDAQDLVDKVGQAPSRPRCAWLTYDRQQRPSHGVVEQIERSRDGKVALRRQRRRNGTRRRCGRHTGRRVERYAA